VLVALRPANVIRFRIQQLAFSPPMADPPADGLVKDLARAADGESDCHDAVERLRRDSRVRSADIDTRRQHQGA